MHLLHQMPWVSCHNGRTACSVGLSLLQAIKWYMHNECTQSSENKIGCAHRRFLLQNRLLLFFQQNLPLRSALFWKFSLLDCHLYVASVLLSHWPGTCIWHPDVFFFFFIYVLILAEWLKPKVSIEWRGLRRTLSESSWDVGGPITIDTHQTKLLSMIQSALPTSSSQVTSDKDGPHACPWFSCGI